MKSVAQYGVIVRNLIWPCDTYELRAWPCCFKGIRSPDR